MEAFAATGPPPFLATPGEPAIPWVDWVPLFENFLLAVGGEAFSEARQRALLLHSLGTEGQRIYNSLPATVKQEGETVLQQTMRVLDDFFRPKTNIVAERYRFRSRAQRTNETTSQWVSSLRQLATTCGYGDRTEEFIRDQIVEKTTSARIRQRLLLEQDLDLQRALTIAATVETAEREALAMQGAGPASTTPRPPSSQTPVVSAVHRQGQGRGAVPRRSAYQPAFQPPSSGRAPGGGARPSASAPASAESKVDPTCFCCGASTGGRLWIGKLNRA